MAPKAPMAPISLPHAFAIPGLHQAPTMNDLKQSSMTYNKLPHAGTQPQIPGHRLRDVLSMIKRYGMEDSFGAHLIHRHDQIGEGMLRVESVLKTMPGSWSQASPIENLDLLNIHGHVFKLMPDKRFVAYEFCDGSPFASLAGTDPLFFRELTGYLSENNLTDLIGLEVLHKVRPQHMVELEMNEGATLLLPEDEVNFGSLDRATGWTHSGKDGSPGTDSGPEPGTHWVKLTNGKHKVFVDGVNPETEENMMSRLKMEGVLRV